MNNNMSMFQSFMLENPYYIFGLTCTCSGSEVRKACERAKKLEEIQALEQYKANFDPGGFPMPERSSENMNNARMLLNDPYNKWKWFSFADPSYGNKNWMMQRLEGPYTYDTFLAGYYRLLYMDNRFQKCKEWISCFYLLDSYTDPEREKKEKRLCGHLFEGDRNDILPELAVNSFRENILEPLILLINVADPETIVHFNKTIYRSLVQVMEKSFSAQKILPAYNNCLRGLLNKKLNILNRIQIRERDRVTDDEIGEIIKAYDFFEKKELPIITEIIHSLEEGDELRDTLGIILNEPLKKYSWMLRDRVPVIAARMVSIAVCYEMDKTVKQNAIDYYIKFLAELERIPRKEFTGKQLLTMGEYYLKQGKKGEALKMLFSTRDVYERYRKGTLLRKDRWRMNDFTLKEGAKLNSIMETILSGCQATCQFNSRRSQPVICLISLLWRREGCRFGLSLKHKNKTIDTYEVVIDTLKVGSNSLTFSYEYEVQPRYIKEERTLIPEGAPAGLYESQVISFVLRLKRKIDRQSAYTALIRFKLGEGRAEITEINQ